MDDINWERLVGVGCGLVRFRDVEFCIDVSSLVSFVMQFQVR